jgi:hypothetical protein
MAAELTILTHKIAIQLHLVAESCTICSSCSRWPVRELLETLSTLFILALCFPLYVSLYSEQRFLSDMGTILAL